MSETDDRGEAWITTVSGRRVWPLEPRPEDFHWPDVACGLAHAARWFGQTLKFYSCAEHAVRLCAEMERLQHLSAQAAPQYAHAFDPRDLLAALLRDVPAAFGMPDFPGRIANRVWGHQAAQARLRDAAWAALYPGQRFPERTQLEAFTMARLTWAEATDLAPAATRFVQLRGEPPAPWYDTIAPLASDDAQALWLTRFDRLTKRDPQPVRPDPETCR